MEWFYADDAGARQGPVDLAALQRALRAGAIDGLSLVWAPALGAEWRPLGEVPALKAALLEAAAAEGDSDADGDDGDGDGEGAAHAAAPGAASADGGSGAPGGAPQPARMYYYADPAGAQAGPAAAPAFASLLAGGFVDAGSLVWSAPMPAWAPLSSVPELATLLLADAGSGEGRGAAAGDRKRKRPKPEGRWRGGGGGGGGWVYVTGLPPDATELELAAHFKKAGLVKLDDVSQAPRVRLYRHPRAATTGGEEGGADSTGGGDGGGGGDGDGPLKGDASVCFVQEASVELAVQLLDGVDLRPGCVCCASVCCATRACWARGGVGEWGGWGSWRVRVDRRRRRGSRFIHARTRVGAIDALSFGGPTTGRVALAGVSL